MKIMEKMKIDPEGFFEILWTSDKSQVATMVLKPGQESSSEKEYHKADQITYCLEGEGTVTVETKKIILKEKELIALNAKGLESPYIICSAGVLGKATRSFMSSGKR